MLSLKLVLLGFLASPNKCKTLYVIKLIGIDAITANAELSKLRCSIKNLKLSFVEFSSKSIYKSVAALGTSSMYA